MKKSLATSNNTLIKSLYDDLINVLLDVALSASQSY
jgi:hypothetical protein